MKVSLFYPNIILMYKWTSMSRHLGYGKQSIYYGSKNVSFFVQNKKKHKKNIFVNYTIFHDMMFLKYFYSLMFWIH